MFDLYQTHFICLYTLGYIKLSCTKRVASRNRLRSLAPKDLHWQWEVGSSQPTGLCKWDSRSTHTHSRGSWGGRGVPEAVGEMNDEPPKCERSTRAHQVLSLHWWATPHSSPPPPLLPFPLPYPPQTQGDCPYPPLASPAYPSSDPADWPPACPGFFLPGCITEGFLISWLHFVSSMIEPTACHCCVPNV